GFWRTEYGDMDLAILVVRSAWTILGERGRRSESRDQTDQRGSESLHGECFIGGVEPIGFWHFRHAMSQRLTPTTRLCCRGRPRRGRAHLEQRLQSDRKS